jgi:heme oxygenase (biliverdin-IX-beta and delta-forming)
MTSETKVLHPAHTPEQELLSDRFRSETRTTHEGVDHAIMAAEPFASIANYGLYLRVQYGLHRDVEPLYHHPAPSEFKDVFSVVQGRSRFQDVTRDAVDLNLDIPPHNASPLCKEMEPAAALGWLYVVEGSNLGAAFLLKYAKEMGLSESHGARHLSAPPEGRAPYWRAFKETLNALSLSVEQDARAMDGARAAFAHVHTLVRQHLAHA